MADAPNQNSDPTSVAYYQAVTTAWHSSMLERDKSVLAIASAGLAAMLAGVVSLSTTDKLVSYWWLIPATISMVFFFICLQLSLRVFRSNADYLRLAYKRKVTKADTANLRALKNDAEQVLLFGIFFAIITGLVVVLQRNFEPVPSTNQEQSMHNPKIDQFKHLFGDKAVLREYEDIIDFDPRPVEPSYSTPQDTTSPQQTQVQTQQPETPKK